PDGDVGGRAFARDEGIAPQVRALARVRLDAVEVAVRHVDVPVRVDSQTGDARAPLTVAGSFLAEAPEQLVRDRRSGLSRLAVHPRGRRDGAHERHEQHDGNREWSPTPGLSHLELSFSVGRLERARRWRPPRL